MSSINRAPRAAVATQCEGRWFMRVGLTILHGDDPEDLAGMAARMHAGETVCLGEGYRICTHEASGREIAIPDPAIMTPLQRRVALRLIEDGLKEAFGA